MAELTLPRWIITQKCISYGLRQGKKPVLVQPRTGYNPHTDEFTPEAIPNVFEGWEYRFWAMTSWPNGATTHVITECRACGNVGGNDTAARRMHTAQGGCCKKLIAAYKLLARDKVCVICNQRTSKDKWGVPLCGNTCQQAWCEADSQPKALHDALLLIGDV